MKIGLTGDTHNNLKNVAKICDIFNAHDLDFVIHTGDISLPKTLLAFDILKMPLMGVFGNNDQDEKALNYFNQAYGNFDAGGIEQQSLA